MAGNIKIHGIAIALICVIVVIAYAVIGPKQTAPGAQVSSGYAIKIASATWGQNCNPYMAEAIANQQAMPDLKDAQGNPVTQPAITPVAADNVLTRVGAACDGKPICELAANTETLGVDPLPGCFKRLVVNYRCFNYDLPSTKDIGQGETLAIDCNPKPAANAPAKQ